MPIYEYRCRKCDHQFELLVRTSAAPPVCATCQATDVEKLLSVPAAPASSTNALPLCGPRPSFGGCGLPQCGMGGCQGGAA